MAHYHTLQLHAKMDEKATLNALGQATSDMKIEDDGTADRKILIAVDFGTTFSGVAWAQTRRVWDPQKNDCSIDC